MEPLDERQLDDKELNHLLQQWGAPAAPASLRKRIPSPRFPRWQWLFKGSIRIPVPVGLLAVVAFAVWMFAGKPVEVPSPSTGVNSLADFQPVRQLQPKVITTRDEGHDNDVQYK